MKKGIRKSKVNKNNSKIFWRWFLIILAVILVIGVYLSNRNITGNVPEEEGGDEISSDLSADSAENFDETNSESLESSEINESDLPSDLDYQTSSEESQNITSDCEVGDLNCDTATINQSCIPSYFCELEPAICPASGNQKNVCKDSECGAESYTEIVQCNYGTQSEEQVINDSDKVQSSIGKKIVVKTLCRMSNILDSSEYNQCINEYLNS